MEDFDTRIRELKSSHALTLAAWAILNIITGAILVILTDDILYYFSLMNLCWGIINALFAIFIYFHHNNDLLKPQTLLQQMDNQRHAEKVILFNFGLDLAFIACGAALFAFGMSTSIAYSSLWQGFGISVMVQALFLAIQDYYFYWLHVDNRNKAHPIWKQKIEKLHKQ